MIEDLRSITTRRPRLDCRDEGAICKNASFFDGHRIMRRYVTEAYTR